MLGRRASASAHTDILIATGSLSFTLPSLSLSLSLLPVSLSLYLLTLSSRLNLHILTLPARRPEQDHTLTVQSLLLKGC